MQRVRISFFWPAAIALVLTGVACGNKPASNNDGALTNDIKAKLYSDAAVKGAPINVSVKDGNATLSGEVPSSDVELEAMKVANSVSGVQKVNDQMKVNPSLAANQPPAENLASSTSASTPPPPSSTAASTPPPVVPDSRPAPSEAAAPPPAPVKSRPSTYTIPAGDRVAVRMIDAIDSGKAQMGQTFRASLDAPLTSHGRVVIPAGAPAVVKLTNLTKAGRVRGNNEITLELASIEYGGKSYEIDSSTIEETGKAKGKQTAIRSGIGAAAGALIGGLAGGGKGAGIGAAAGGGGVLGYQLFTHGSKVKVPSETVVNFRLESPLTVTAAPRGRTSREE
jgi:BON domain